MKFLFFVSCFFCLLVHADKGLASKNLTGDLASRRIPDQVTVSNGVVSQGIPDKDNASKLVSNKNTADRSPATRNIASKGVVSDSVADRNSVIEGITIASKDIARAEALFKQLPLQHQGRIKPFDTVARESLREIYGREHYKGKSAVQIFLLIILIPDIWNKTPLFLVEKEIKKTLGWPLKKKHFSFEELNNNQKLLFQFSELQSLQQSGVERDSYFTLLEKLQNRMAIFYSGIQKGLLVRSEPNPKGDLWLSLSELPLEKQEKFRKLLSIYADFLLKQPALKGFTQTTEPGPEGQIWSKSSYPRPEKIQQKNYLFFLNWLKGYKWGSSPGFDKKSSQFSDFKKAMEDFRFYGKNKTSKKIESLTLSQGLIDKEKKLSGQKNPPSSAYQGGTDKLGNTNGLYGPSSAYQGGMLESSNQSSINKIKTEVFYNSFKPFQKAWIFYLLFLIGVIFTSVFKKPAYFKYTVFLAGLGFLCHSLGMFLRSYIMSRPPVSNMYETVIWVPFVALIVGFIFYLRGNKWPFLAGALLGFFCLLLSSLAPDVLDGRLNNLEAVLRSSFWLSTHVLTITMSYSFFFLAFVLGDMALIAFLFNKNLGFAKKMYQPIYRMIQWGVLFLATGTILGAIWADYSWGRFWGWDPKESWALITLLAYLALLHGKLIGLIKPFNMALLSVMLFFLVIMAWYGVNFVLGAGLHSYGFGSGGIEYVLAFFALHVLLALVSLVQKKRIQNV